MKLEVVVIPVSDVDRAKAFYAAAGFRDDGDFSGADGFRAIQFTPPGSQASIIFGSGITTAAPGSAQGLLLVVDDIDTARSDLVARGLDVGPVFHDMGGVFFRPSPEHDVPGRAPGGRSYASFARFTDPDGNGWALQEVRQRLPGR